MVTNTTYLPSRTHGSTRTATAYVLRSAERTQSRSRGSAGGIACAPLRLTGKAEEAHPNGDRLQSDSSTESIELSTVILAGGDGDAILAEAAVV
eukprot:COSAG06_NODE_4886_length_3882_cov_4.313508_3_plen_94_part_00